MQAGVERAAQEGTSGTAMAVATTMNIVFIGGCDRSGSTLLARLIGGAPGVCNLGELRALWGNALAENRLCGCGVPLHSCGFWDAVMSDAFGGAERLPLSRMCELRRRVDRMRHVPLLMSTRPPARFARELGEYRGVVGAVLRAAMKVSGAGLLVDSTKSPSAALVLGGVPGARVGMAHLVRDSRAVAWSFGRTKTEPSIHWKPSFMDRRGVLYAAAHWVRTNVLAEVGARRLAGAARVHYEGLAARPAAVIGTLMDELGLPRVATGLVDRTAPCPVVQHTIAGNPMRFQKGALKVASDDEWQTAMPAAARLLTTVLTLPLLLRYGYPVSARRIAGHEGRTGTCAGE